MAKLIKAQANFFFIHVHEVAIPKSGVQGISIESGQDKGFYNSGVGDLVSQ